MGYYLYLESDPPISSDEIAELVEENSEWLRFYDRTLLADSVESGSTEEDLMIWDPDEEKWAPGIWRSPGGLSLNGAWADLDAVVEALDRLMNAYPFELRGEEGERYEVNEGKLVVVGGPPEEPRNRIDRREKAFSEGNRRIARAHSPEFHHIEALFDISRWKAGALVEWIKATYVGCGMLHQDWHDVSELTVDWFETAIEARRFVVYEVMEAEQTGRRCRVVARSVPGELAEAFTRLPGLLYWSAGYGLWFDRCCAGTGDRLPSEDLIDVGWKIPRLEYHNEAIRVVSGISGTDVLYTWHTGLGGKVDVERDYASMDARQPMGEFETSLGTWKMGRRMWFHREARRAIGIPARLASGPVIGSGDVFEYDDGALGFEFGSSFYDDPEEFWFDARAWLSWMQRITSGGFEPRKRNGASRPSNRVYLEVGTEVGTVGDFDVAATIHLPSESPQEARGKVREWRLVDHQELSRRTVGYVEKMIGELKAEIDGVLSRRSANH